MIDFPKPSRVRRQGQPYRKASAAPRMPRVIAVTGGKGGVGKSCVAVNLAMALALGRHDTLLLDTDLGLANIDVLLGLQPEHTLTDLLAGDCSLSDLVVRAPGGLKVIPAGSGHRAMTGLSRLQIAAVIRAFDGYPMPPEFLIVDIAAGISDAVTMFSAAADDVLVVVCDEPASLTDAYAFIKVLSSESGVRRFKVVANRVDDAAHGRRLFGKLERVTSRFLDVVLDLGGLIPNDACLRRAVQHQTSLADAWPGSPSALAFKKLALAAENWNEPSGAADRIGFFAGRSASLDSEVA